MIIKKLFPVILTLIFLFAFTGAVFADDITQPTFPDIFAGSIIDQEGRDVDDGEVRVYIDDEFKGSIEIDNGEYERLLVQGSMDDVGKEVSFKIFVSGVELPAQSDPEVVTFRSGKICGLDMPKIDLTVDLTQIPELVAPTASPDSGEFTDDVTVSLGCSTEGAAIYYTTDGSNPKNSSSREEYTEAITLDETTTIKAVAERGGEYSSVETFEYEFIVLTVEVDASPSSMTLKLGDTREIDVDTDPSSADVDFDTSDRSVATVSSSGLVKAKGVGTATITVTGTESGMEEGTDTVSVTVLEEPIEIDVDASMALKVGESKQLDVSTDPSDADIEYISSNSDIVTVSSNGTVIAVGEGSAIITISCSKEDYDTTTESVLVIVSAAVKIPNFTDLPSNHWAHGIIIELSSKSIIGGYADSTFKPGNNITRAEFIKILVGAMGMSAETPTEATYSDVSTNAWFYGWVEAAVDAGLVKGDGTGKFRPNAKITRQEMATILIRALNKDSAAEANSDKNSGFADDGDIASWARGFVVTAVNEGLIGGYNDNTFKPKNNATRAEACVMIQRFMQK